MERLFSPCTRLHDLILNQDDIDQGVRDVLLEREELNLNVSTQELLSVESAFTNADLSSMLGNDNTVAWLTPHAAVARSSARLMYAWDELDESCRFRFITDDTDIFALALSSEHLLEICDVVLRLLAVSEVHRVILKKWRSLPGLLIDAPTFAYMLEQCQSLKFLSLVSLNLDENHCRVLGTYSRPDLEIELKYCKITSAGAIVLAEVLGRNQGPTKLDCCEIDNSILADGLRGNSHLKSLKPHLFSNLEFGNQQVLAIVGALRENKGLVDLNLRQYGFRLNNETWDSICDSLKTHPTLEVLHFPRGGNTDSTAASALIISQIQKLVDMLKVNRSIQRMHLDACYRDHELYRESVIPYLETNRFRPRLLAMQKTRPLSYRAKVLGRALLSARTDANRSWMLLSGNAEVAVLSSTAVIAAAANLPTPVTSTATAISTANDAAIAASVMSALTAGLPTTAATAASSAATPPSPSDAFPFAPAPTAAANVAAPSDGQKRQAHP
jgi:hypothetical protein